MVDILPHVWDTELPREFLAARHPIPLRGTTARIVILGAASSMPKAAITRPSIIPARPASGRALKPFHIPRRRQQGLHKPLTRTTGLLPFSKIPFPTSEPFRSFT